MSQTLNLTCVDTLPTTGRLMSGGSVIDITGYTITMRIELADGVLEKTAVITDAANGQYEFRWLATDLTTAGAYPAEIKITNASAQIVTSKQFVIIAKARI
jgi:hypothetical protein